MATGSFSLALERTKLPAHLSLKILQAHEVRLRRLDPPFGPLTAAAELEYPGSLLDDGPPVFRAGLQDGVELALAHDDVLLPANAGVGEQLLDVE